MEGMSDQCPPDQPPPDQCPSEQSRRRPVRTREAMLRKIQQLRRRISRLQAEELETVAEFVRAAEEPSTVPQELALGLAIGRHVAAGEVELGVALTTRLPETLNAMRRGEIDAYKAMKVHEPTMILTDEQAREVDAVMAGRLAGKDPGGVRRAVNRVVARVNPDGYAERCRARRARRRVELIPLDDGMVRVAGDLPAEKGVAAYVRIDTEARRRRRTDKSKTLEQHRADAYADLLLKDGYGITAGPRAEVYVYIDFETWLGLNDRPAEMAGQGLIPAWLARQIANGENTTLRRILTDPETGQIVSVGRNAYRPPADLARLIRVRDRECRMYGCHRPAQSCDLDHGEQWLTDHGETADENLAALCRFHHRLKDSSEWTYDLDKQTGRFTVTTPTGDQYSTDPEPLHEPRTRPPETETRSDPRETGPTATENATSDEHPAGSGPERPDPPPPDPPPQ
jgi:hypothetical protein